MEEVSKIGVKILKHLKNKNDKYDLLNKSSKQESTMSFYQELKELLPNKSYMRLTTELMHLLEERLIYVNDTRAVHEFPETKDLKTFKFALAGRGYAFLEERNYRRVSKYIPLTVSIVSILIAAASLFHTIYSK